MAHSRFPDFAAVARLLESFPHLAKLSFVQNVWEWDNGVGLEEARLSIRGGIKTTRVPLRELTTNLTPWLSELLSAYLPVSSSLETLSTLCLLAYDYSHLPLIAPILRDVSSALAILKLQCNIVVSRCAAQAIEIFVCENRRARY